MTGLRVKKQNKEKKTTEGPIYGGYYMRVNIYDDF